MHHQNNKKQMGPVLEQLQKKENRAPSAIEAEREASLPTTLLPPLIVMCGQASRDHLLRHRVLESIICTQLLAKETKLQNKQTKTKDIRRVDFIDFLVRMVHLSKLVAPLWLFSSLVIELCILSRGSQAFSSQFAN